MSEFVDDYEYGERQDDLERLDKCYHP